jgi:hypothetical protein
MPSNGPSSAQTPQSRNEPTASVAEANPANQPRRRKTFNPWARLVAGFILVVSVIAVTFFAGFFTEREYHLFPALEYSLVSGEDGCINLSCSPAGRFGQHCRQVRVPC